MRIHWGIFAIAVLGAAYVFHVLASGAVGNWGRNAVGDKAFFSWLFTAPGFLLLILFAVVFCIGYWHRGQRDNSPTQSRDDPA